MSSTPDTEPFAVARTKGGYAIAPRYGTAFAIHVVTNGKSSGAQVHIVADGVHAIDQAVIFERAMMKVIELMSRPADLTERPVLGPETRRKDER